MLLTGRCSQRTESVDTPCSSALNTSVMWLVGLTDDDAGDNEKRFEDKMRARGRRRRRRRSSSAFTPSAAEDLGPTADILHHRSLSRFLYCLYKTVIRGGVKEEKS